MTLVSPSAVQYVLGPGATWTDVVRSVIDVAVLGYLFYRVLLLLRGTRALRVLAGLILLSITYLVSQWANLVTLNWFLGSFLSYTLIFGLIVLFQADIRRGLARLGRGGGFLAALTWDERRTQSGTVEAVARTAAELSRRRCGALVVLERHGDLGEVVETGVRLDAELSPEILLAIFHNGGALHDGAVIVHRGRVVAAGCLLPLASAPTARELGTRHRAALGLVEEVDAMVVVVSEERGEISVAMDGELRRGLDESALRQVLAREFLPSKASVPGGLWTRLSRAAERQPAPRRDGGRPLTMRSAELGLRVLSVALAFALMVVVHGERRITATFVVPVEAQLPPSLEPAAALPASLRVSVAGPWARLRSLRASDLGPITIDVSRTSPETATWSVSPESLHLPTGLQLESLYPSQGTVGLSRPR